MASEKKPVVPTTPIPSESVERIEELTSLWENDSLSLDDKLAATFRGFGHLLEPHVQEAAKEPSRRSRKRRG
jgi:hypothetical protein